MLYLINKIAWAILNPLSIGLIFLMITVILAFRKSISRRIIVWLSLCVLVWIWFWSTSLPMLFLVIGMQENYPQERIVDIPNGDVIVVMGGGISNGKFYPELHESADRTVYAARLWKANKAPVIIPSGLGVAQTDAKFLRELGVAEEAIVVENNARNTEENARFVSELLSEKWVDKSRRCKVLLVTSMWHMRRSMLMFQLYAPELEIIPVSTDGVSKRYIQLKDFLPDAGAILNNTVLLHEVVGYWWYKFFR